MDDLRCQNWRQGCVFVNISFMFYRLLREQGRYNFTFSVPKHFNYISFQVQRFSNQGVDIDACVDKAANIQNEINKDFEQRVTANFAQCSASNSEHCNNRIFYNCFVIQNDFYDAFMFVDIFVLCSRNYLSCGLKLFVFVMTLKQY